MKVNQIVYYRKRFGFISKKLILQSEVTWVSGHTSIIDDSELKLIDAVDTPIDFEEVKESELVIKATIHDAGKKLLLEFIKPTISGSEVKLDKMQITEQNSVPRIMYNLDNNKQIVVGLYRCKIY